MSSPGRSVREIRPLWRFLPLLTAAALLATRLTLLGTSWGSAASFAAVGFGLLIASCLLHALAVRFPDKYALDGLAWISTIVTAIVLVVLIVPAGGR